MSRRFSFPQENPQPKTWRWENIAAWVTALVAFLLIYSFAAEIPVLSGICITLLVIQGAIYALKWIVDTFAYKIDTHEERPDPYL